MWIHLPDGAVLFSPETEVYYGMNSVAAAIWELLPQSGGTMDMLCSAIGKRFPDALLGQIHTDVVDLLGELERSGLVEPIQSDSAA